MSNYDLESDTVTLQANIEPAQLDAITLGADGYDVGDVVSVEVNGNGLTPTANDLTISWYRFSSSDNPIYSTDYLISDENGQTYTTQEDDGGKYIGCKVVAQNNFTGTLTAILTTPITEPEHAPLPLDIAFEPYNDSYDGESHKCVVEITGDDADATIFYTLDDIETTMKPLIRNAGTYSVQVKAEKDGYITKEETVTCVIEPIPLVVGNVVINKMYDGTDTVEDSEITLSGISGFVGSDSEHYALKATISNVTKQGASNRAKQATVHYDVVLKED